MSRERDKHDEAYEAVRAWWKAWVEKDMEAVRRLTADDYLEYMDARRQPIGLGELLREADRYCKEVSITRWELSAPTTKVFDDSVVCSYRFSVSGQYGNRRFAFSGWASDTLTSRGGRLVIASHRGAIEGRVAATRGGEMASRQRQRTHLDQE